MSDEDPPPRRYVVVEGVIGVGKTTLVHRLGEVFGARTVLERFEDNPFLPGFYRDRDAHALSTQLFFLMSRYRQQAELSQPDLFRPFTLADYLFDKDQIFAGLTLSSDERRLYDQLFAVLSPQVPRPDLVIYLRAGVAVLSERIRIRGRSYEKDLDPGYLRDLAAAYDRFFARWRGAPVVTVDVGRLDLRRDGPVYATLVEKARSGEGPSFIGADGDLFTGAGS
ncbi:MAG: deoxynucleoside kinase [Myxococcota bacterium]